MHDSSLDVVFQGFVFRFLPFVGIELEKIVLKTENSLQTSALAIAHRLNNFVQGLD
jgi:hypothetical protein